jgi:hypothetical protein
MFSYAKMSCDDAVLAGSALDWFFRSSPENILGPFYFCASTDVFKEVFGD